MSPPTDFLSGTGKPPPEKSNFLQTCNRLSLFLKENTKFRDVNFTINAKLAATGVLDDVCPEAEGRTIELLSSIDDVCPAPPPPPSEYVILDSSSIEVEKAAGSSNKTSTAQMTIFYGGQVLVLDDVPADRARDVMLMAKNGIQTSRSKEKQVADSDLPIARRASLHKFLAKRKDRATVRAAPYHPLNHTFDLNSNP